MSDHAATSCTAFAGHRSMSAGPLAEVALVVRTAMKDDPAASILVFDDSTGRVVDLDLRGTEAEVVERLSAPLPKPVGRFRPRPESVAETETAPRGRGRPKLGVVAREVTLLPWQWEWLATQPGGASATLRKLVDSARRSDDSRGSRRRAQEAAYKFMNAIAGDLSGYEEATRALFADDRPGFEDRIADWPEDVRVYALRLAFGE